MTNKNDCEHDLLAILHCKKCGDQQHINWLEGLHQAKMEAVDEVLRRTKTTIAVRTKAKYKKEVMKLALEALAEVREVYEQSKATQKKSKKKSSSSVKVTYRSTDQD